MWSDIPPVSPAARERLGYPTQLLERIIAASSNEGKLRAGFPSAAAAQPSMRRAGSSAGGAASTSRLYRLARGGHHELLPRRRVWRSHSPPRAAAPGRPAGDGYGLMTMVPFLPTATKRPLPPSNVV